MRPLLVIAIALLSGWVLAGCARLPPAIATGSDLVSTPDGLTPLVHSGFARTWVRPGTSFARYDRIRVYTGEISYRHSPTSSRGSLAGDNFSLPVGMKKNLEESFRRSIEAAFTQRLEAGTEEASAAGVLLVRGLLGDLVVHAPLDALGGDNLAWVDSVGEITLLIELYDGETRELIGRVLDRRALTSGWDRPVRATVGDASFEAIRIFQDWAKRLASLVDALREVDLTARTEARPRGSPAPEDAGQLARG